MPIPLAIPFFAWLAAALPAIVWKILKILGIGIIAYAGIDVALDALETWIISSFSGLPVIVITVLQKTGIDKAIQVIFATYAAVLVVCTTRKSFKFNC